MAHGRALKNNCLVSDLVTLPRHPDRSELASGAEGSRPAVLLTEIPRLRSFVAPLGMTMGRRRRLVSLSQTHTLSFLLSGGPRLRTLTMTGRISTSRSVCSGLIGPIC